jgi:hypothetical protein
LEGNYEEMGNLINRNYDNPEYNKLLLEIGVTIDRCVDYGESVLDEIQKHPRNEYVDSTVSLLFRDYLEFLDGVAVLIKNSCIESAIPILRSMFEHFLYLIFILEKHQDSRAAAYHVAHVKSKQKFYKNFSNSGFKDKLTQNDYPMELPDKNLSKEIESLEKLLEKGKYKIVNDEWERTRKNNYKNRQPNWYSLYNGPKTIKDLAYDMKRVAEYEILYRLWSSKTHGNSSINSVVSGGVKSIRHPESLKMVGTWAFSWTFILFLKILRYYRKRKQINFGYFYYEVRKVYLKLSNGKDLVKIIYED